MLVTVFEKESFLLFVEFDITWISLQNVHQKMKRSYLIFDTLHWEPLLSEGLIFWRVVLDQLMENLFSLFGIYTEISQKFNVQWEPKHVDNHLKTVKKEWGIITKLKNKSGFGWDDCLKMITISKDIYDEEVMINIILFVIFIFTFVSKMLYKELKNCIF